MGSHDGNVYALNASDGAKLWNYTSGSWVWSSPAVVNGVVYAGSNDGNVYALGGSPTSSPSPSSSLTASASPSIPEVPPLFAVAALIVATCSIAIAIRKKRSAQFAWRAI
jgi:outer membrane protein assembly factor BamB